MLFSTPVFLFLFLPLVLALHLVLPRPARNAFLLVVSLYFYAWGEKFYVGVLLASIAVNYVAGLALARIRRPALRHVVLGLTVVANLGLLAAFKYANFLVDNLSALFAALGRYPIVLPPVHLPLGISFFTFHALSYVIDIYRNEVKALRNPVDFALYIAFFPQSIAGPIVRYHDVASQLSNRSITAEKWTAGVVQFILGLSKKMLIANAVARPADAIFGLPADALTAGLAWLSAACYTLQIYFDFSGYSDMAIGLARMLGFELKANFDYPYVSRSITEFWRRWHISLSSWFRDYLYIPLGGNRHGALRTYLNLVLVFFLCGLWHGASWAFVGWGLYHGLFLVLERMGLGKRLERLPSLLRHGYLLVVVMVGWVFFRAETFGGAMAVIRAMVGLAPASAVEYVPAVYLRPDVVLALIAGAFFSMPIVPWLIEQRRRLTAALATRPHWAEAFETVAALATLVGLSAVLVEAAMLLAGNTYNPFIYFRF